MGNIFNSIPKVEAKWTVSLDNPPMPFSAEEIACIQSAEVRDSKYGQSVCFLLTSGEYAFIPLDSNCTIPSGTFVDPAKMIVVTLCKPGREDIKRIRFSK